MILLSFLGAAAYHAAAYVWTDAQGAEHTHTSAYATVALASFLQPERVVLFATAEARAAHLEEVRAELGASVPLDVADVPAGHTEDELWAVFAAIADRVPHGASVALDVTHGFRSLPMVGLLAAGYLQAARRATVKHVLYGSWEARGDGDPPRTPVVDLTPMFSLTEWAVAANRFDRSGDSRDLASLLRAAAPGYRADARSDAPQGRLAAALRRLSLALFLTQPLRVMQSAERLNTRLRDMEGHYPSRAAPFQRLLEDVRAAYAPLALAEPRDAGCVGQCLAIQRALVHWYLERDLYVQAATLAREWVVSWRVAWRGDGDLTSRSARADAECELGRLIDAQKHGQVRLNLPGVPAGVDLGTLWNQLVDVRNAMCHGGMSANDPQPENLVDRLGSLVQSLDALPIPGATEAEP